MKGTYPLRDEKQREALEMMLEAYTVIGRGYWAIKELMNEKRIAPDSTYYRRTMELILINDEFISDVRDRLAGKIDDNELEISLHRLRGLLIQMKTPQLNVDGGN